jgi:transcriptional antiterminator/mannitol/fructose-specific phosphotransferase system IIA component (Ntr-type)
MKLLRMLSAKQGHEYTLAEMADHFGVSQKTIRHDIRDINDFLQDDHMGKVQIGQGGLLSLSDDFKASEVEKKLAGMDAYEYRLSPEERLLYIRAALLSDTGYIIMQKLADELFVTRVTILSDFDTLKKQLDEEGIRLIHEPGRGSRLDCTIEQRIEMLIRLFRGISVNTRHVGLFQRMVLEKLQVACPYEIVFSCMQEYTSDNNLLFSDDVYYELSLYLYAVFNLRIRDKDESQVTEGDPLPVMDGLLVHLGSRFGVRVSRSMIRRFRDYRQKNHLDPYVRSIDEMELSEVIVHFLTAVDRDLHMELSGDNVLIHSLLMHIRTMKDWGDLEIELPGEGTEGIDYEAVKKAVAAHISILEKYLGYHVNHNMRNSIVIHICVSLVRNRDRIPRLTVVIVCPGSMATGRYLEAQVQRYFNFQIAGVVAAADVERRLSVIGPVDFVLSTVNITIRQCPVLTVSAVLTMEDMNRIQTLAFRVGQKGAQAQTAFDREGIQMLRMLQSCIDEGHMNEKLCHEIRNMLVQYEKQKQVQRTEMGTLLKKEWIQAAPASISWEDAIRLAGRPLVEAGAVGQPYIEQCIRNVQEYGDYIVIGRGVALAHARSSADVQRDCLSLLVSKGGIIFSDGETKVNFLFCFASTGKNYADLVREIGALGRSSERKAELLDMDAGEIYQTLCFSHQN